MQDNNWDSQRKSVGEIGDQYVQPQDERKAVQKRTFTRWMNVFLQRRNPAVEVHDLFTDIQDGRILMALLEELSGCKLLYRFRSSSHRIFRLNNISKALAFLDDRHVKLSGIDACGIADGIPSVVLNLVWNIILHFQVKEVTGGLQRHLSSSLSSLSVSSYPSCGDLSPQPNDIGSYSCNTLPSKGRKAARESKYHGKAIKTLLQWVQACTSKYKVDVQDFGNSWRSGLAFLTMIKSINPALVDLRESLSREPIENIQQAFRIAHHNLEIPPLLEPEDVMCTFPDEQSIITYVSMFLGHHSGTFEDYTADIGVSEIPNFVSLDSVNLGEIPSDDPEAQALLESLEKTSEQRLWKRWSRRSSGGSSIASLHTNGAVPSDLSSSRSNQNLTEQPAASSVFNKKKGRCRSVLQPPSPLDAGIVSQEIRLWMEKSSDQVYGKQSRFSLSSEEGMYSLSALDSDEEDAYSYILDLNKEVFQPYNQSKRQVAKVEEETAKELNEESQHPETCEASNGSGCKHQEGKPAQKADFDVEPEVRVQSMTHGKFDLDKNESSTREMPNNRAAFDLKAESPSNKEHEEEEIWVVRGQSNDDGDYCEEEREKEMVNARLVMDEYSKKEDDAVKGKIFEVASWQKHDEEGGERELSEKCRQVSERRTVQEDLGRFEEGDELEEQNEREENGVKEEDRKNLQDLVSFTVGVDKKILTDEATYEVKRISAAGIRTEGESNRRDNAVTTDLTQNSKEKEKMKDTDDVKDATDLGPVYTANGKDKEVRIIRNTDLTSTAAHPGDTPKNDIDGDLDIQDDDNNWAPSYSSTSPSFSRERELTLQSPADSCDITPLELDTLLVLWILLYCCLVLPQMNL